MYNDESWSKKVLKWCGRKLEDLVLTLGLTKSLVFLVAFCVLIGGIIYLFSWLGSIETNVKIGRMKESVEVQEEIVISVTREAKVSDGYSIGSMLWDGVTSFSSEADAITAFNDLTEACDNMSDKKETLVIPQGAGGASLDSISIYMWSKSGKYLLTGKEFTETHAVLIMGEGYVYIVLDGSKLGFGATAETGYIN